MPGQECYTDQIHLLMLLMLLILAIVSMLCAFGFFREDKDEMFTPLTPQLVVKKEAQLTLRLPYDTQEDSFSITRLGGEVFCKVEAEWPDPFRDSSASAAGVLGTIKIQSARGNTIALVRARHSTMGQSLQLCRPTVHDYMTDMFAFVEPEGENRFCIRHRTGYPLLTLQGNFQGPGVHVQGRNKDKALICELKAGLGDLYECFVLQYVDAGLVIGGLMAVRLQHQIMERASQVSPGRELASEEGHVTGAHEAEEVTSVPGAPLEGSEELPASPA